jgi:hypothetical protein
MKQDDLAKKPVRCSGRIGLEKARSSQISCCNSEDNKTCCSSSSASMTSERYASAQYMIDAFCLQTVFNSTDSIVVAGKTKAKRKSSAAALKRRMANQIPEEIVNDPELKKAIEQVLYTFSSFQIHFVIYLFSL